MLTYRLSLLAAVGIVLACVSAAAQTDRESQRIWEEQQRRIADASRERQLRAEQDRAHELLLLDIDRLRANSNPGSSGTGSFAQSPGDQSFSATAGGVAALLLTASLLHDLFVGGTTSSGIKPPSREGALAGLFNVDPSVERWLQDPFNKPGVPYRYDTPDGKMAKVCLRPFPHVQTIVYRWDAPNEVSLATDVQRISTGEHMQFTHPSASGLFAYVIKPAPNHLPSAHVYYLPAHRIGMTGCGHAQAFQIAYPRYGGAAEFERVAGSPRVAQPSQERRRPSPFYDSCAPIHDLETCKCIFFALGEVYAPAYMQYETYKAERLAEILGKKPGLTAKVAQQCKVQF